MAPMQSQKLKSEHVLEVRLSTLMALRPKHDSKAQVLAWMHDQLRGLGSKLEHQHRGTQGRVPLLENPPMQNK